MDEGLQAGRSAVRAKPSAGHVALVGAGPGDPELLTLRAARLIGQARVLVVDHLVSDGVLELARPGAELIYVGKESGHHTLPQEEINALLVRLGREGRLVVRLKGGDPYIFGRGGEEVEALIEAGISFEVVPGITAACGASAYAGIPLTHRDHARSVVFATGHRRAGQDALDWSVLARPQQTAVIYMGVGQLAAHCASLIDHGRGAATPAALVENATSPRQRVVTGTLETLPAIAAQAGIRPPALLIVGEVVSLAGRLQPFPAQPAEAVLAD
ncbi:MAG: uroporphyrinogen-III C-methyltransferase [Zoogloea sp.]|nr:uroporphyrinogen-III C-methyltransferase [Zoogloea sp.]MCA0187217.1 uroporphyrinogen-III C-methyltransferase [Pseudomonadota bacterium]